MAISSFPNCEGTRLHGLTDRVIAHLLFQAVWRPGTLVQGEEKAALDGLPFQVGGHLRPTGYECSRFRPRSSL